YEPVSIKETDGQRGCLFVDSQRGYICSQTMSSYTLQQYLRSRIGEHPRKPLRERFRLKTVGLVKYLHPEGCYIRYDSTCQAVIRQMAQIRLHGGLIEHFL